MTQNILRYTFIYILVTICIALSYASYSTPINAPHKLYSPKTNFDTVLINHTDINCPDYSALPAAIDLGTVKSISNQGAITVKYLPADHCVEFTGIQTGTDTFLVQFKDVMGYQDTTILILTCRLPQSNVVRDSIIEGENEVYCLDVSELSSGAQIAENICTQSADGDIAITTIQHNACYKFRGIQPGGRYCVYAFL